MRISDWSSDVCSSDLRVPMINAVVDGNAVAQIIAAWTGIPVGKMVSDEIQTVLGLRDLLEERVIGQGHALDAIAQRVRTSRANLEDPGKPKGVFLLVGTSGVGKTETAIALAEDRKSTRLNSSH